MGLPSTIGGPSCSVPLVPEDLKFSSFFACGIFNLIGVSRTFRQMEPREKPYPTSSRAFILGESSLLEIH
ncbi:unnamed protein product [Acanthoscelides obtectus]|uniref:Uncharacterized protein n=1 Tax=Acanthoscelides obtectus TaxID=200917 RepID=A0A9P0K439_ACAOB|nr:unnamed protein product [Acanthoscelides obtectus]CAK1658444.1 hypothetical protein AOBTE_LOCUS20896 [Acanthoscelides obtectus]